MIIIGIDPGSKGGIAELRVDDNGIPEIYNLTVLTAENLKSRAAFMRTIEPEHRVFWFVEQQQQSFKGSNQTSFRIGYGYGFVIGCLEGCNVTIDSIVHPASWTSWYKRNFKWYKNFEGDNKERNKKMAKELFPNEKFLATKRSKKPHEGLTDAALIAYYVSQLDTIKNIYQN